MTDRIQHPLSGHQRHGLNDINDGFADTLDGLVKGLEDVLGNLGQGLIDFLNRLTADKEQQPNEAEKKDAYAKLKSWERLAADGEKSQMLGKAANFIKGQFEPAETEAAGGHQDKSQQAELVCDRFIEVPPQISTLPDYELLLAQQRQALEKEAVHSSQDIADASHFKTIDARQVLDEPPHHYEVQQDSAAQVFGEINFNFYTRAAHQLNANCLNQGQEIEAEIIKIAKVGDANYYILETDGKRFVVPTGEEPEYEMGDAIIAVRTKEGFTTDGSYGHGR